MKSVISDARQVEIAVNLVKLGARMQVLDVETSLSRERLLKLYREVKGVSPPKGMLPFSTDWFMTWMPNIHGSLFLDIHTYLRDNAGLTGIEATMKAYELYLEHLETHGLERVMSFTRAWSLLRFVHAKLLDCVTCTQCGARYVMHAMDLHNNYVCGLCHVPSRAGKTLKARAEAQALLATLPPAVPEAPAAVSRRVPVSA
jgi:flagellar transcriptional activator FlhC